MYGGYRFSDEAVSRKKGHPDEIVNRMQEAWWKAMILQVTLWMQPYTREADF
jgi:hypothetical protein